MKFTGRLQIEADPRNWLRTDLNLAHGRVELVSGDELLGSWSTSQVKAERVEGDRFELQLGEDKAVFAADDALAFSYEALPALTKKTVLMAASGLRGKLRKGLATAERMLPGDQEPAPVPAPPPAPVADPVPPADPSDGAPVRKLRDLIHAAVRNNALESTSPEELESLGAWWNRADSSSDAATAEAQRPIDPAVEPLPSAAPLAAAGESSPTAPAPIYVEVEPIVQASRLAPSKGLLDLDGTTLEPGETLGERLAAPFGWVRNGAGPSLADNAEEASAAIEPHSQEDDLVVVRTLDALINEVQQGSMSPAQVGAVTELIRAVAQAIEVRGSN